MNRKKASVKLDAINRLIIEKIHLQADITNQRLAEEIGLSAPACSQRVTALREAGYFFNFHCEIDLERTFEHILAYVEFTLENNSLAVRRAFEAEIEKYPEFMDCFRVSGDADYMSFTCARNLTELNRLCDLVSGKEALQVKNINVRVILDRPKWYLGYPVGKLRWLD